jgi:hypothetical protein
MVQRLPNRRDELTSRSALESAIKKLVDGHAASHKLINLKRAALAILSRHPDCGLSIEQIHKEIEKEAIEGGALFSSDGGNPERR